MESKSNFQPDEIPLRYLYKNIYYRYHHCLLPYYLVYTDRSVYTNLGGFPDFLFRGL